MKIAWTIAGSDSGGGAGVQADIHTFRDFGLHGATVVTCVTAQNSVALTDNHVVPTETVHAQIQALAADLPPDAIKIGALGSAENAAAVIGFLDGLTDRRPFVVWDPVRQATVGGELGTLPDETVRALLQAVDAVTPNLKELAALASHETGSPYAAAVIRDRGPRCVYITGGHGDTPGVDFWSSDTKAFTIQSDTVSGNGAHGGGCSLSSALAAARVREDEDSAPVLAHMYVRQGLRALAANVDAPGTGRPALPHLGWPRQFGDLPKVTDAGKALPDKRFPALDQPLGLYAVVPDVDWLRRCVELELDTVQLRVKDVPSAARRQIIAECVETTRGTGTRLFVNDYWREAVEAGAYGVHLGQEDLTDADLPALARAGIRLGLSTHSYYEIARDARLGAELYRHRAHLCHDHQAHEVRPAGSVPPAALGGPAQGSLPVDGDRRHRRGTSPDGHGNRGRQHRGCACHHRGRRSRRGGRRTARGDGTPAMETTRAHLAAHGRPVAYYSDRYSVFRVNKKDKEDGLTQFSRALRTLDIAAIHAGSPQAKGRVERANRTLQDRLVKEMRLRGIGDIGAGNAYLPEFMADFTGAPGRTAVVGRACPPPVPANPATCVREGGRPQGKRSRPTRTSGRPQGSPLRHNCPPVPRRCI